jgi:hypothetical protein
MSRALGVHTCLKARLGSSSHVHHTDFIIAQRVNVGVSERYLTAGTVDINELLKGTKGDFLGKVDGIGMEDS